MIKQNNFTLHFSSWRGLYAGNNDACINILNLEGRKRQGEQYSKVNCLNDAACKMFTYLQIYLHYIKRVLDSS